MSELEQEIFQCWGIIDDLILLKVTNNLTSENVDSLCSLYRIKFERLFELYEKSIVDKYFE